jgi:hypothetical protein
MMVISLFVLVLVVAFLWMFSRSVKAGHGALLLWLLWAIAGICLLLVIPNEYRREAQASAWLWTAGVIGPPFYWFYRFIRYGGRRPS